MGRGGNVRQFRSQFARCGPMLVQPPSPEGLLPHECCCRLTKGVQGGPGVFWGSLRSFVGLVFPGCSRGVRGVPVVPLSLICFSYEPSFF